MRNPFRSDRVAALERAVMLQAENEALRAEVQDLRDERARRDRRHSFSGLATGLIVIITIAFGGFLFATCVTTCVATMPRIQ